MNSRARFLHSIAGKPIDRFFRYEHGAWPSTRDRWVQEGYPADIGHYADDRGFQAYFAMDPVIRIAIHSGYTDSPYEPCFDECTLEETEDHRLYIDTDGITKRVLKTRSDTSMPQFVRFPVSSRQDWQQIMARLAPEHATRRIGDPTRVVAQCADETAPTILPICGAYGHPRNLLGEEGLAYVLYDDPGLLHEILDNWSALYSALLTELTALVRVDALLIWEDMCYKGGPLINPRDFCTFMLPRYKELIRLARTRGIEAIIVDSDGDVRQMIPLFLEADVNCLMPFEVQAGMDVIKIRETFGRSFCIMGGIDKRSLAEGPQQIAAEVARVIPYFLQSGRFIPTLDHTVPVNVPLSHFRYYLETLRKYESAGRIP